MIDFGSDEPVHQEPSPKEQSNASGNQPPLDPSHPSTADVQELLDSTGTHKQGALIDFHDDMKRDLPVSTKPTTSSIESDDEFLDAQG